MVRLVAEFVLECLAVCHVPCVDHQASHRGLVEQVGDRCLVVAPASVLAQHLQLEGGFEPRSLDRVIEGGSQRWQVGWMGEVADRLGLSAPSDRDADRLHRLVVVHDDRDAWRVVDERSVTLFASPECDVCALQLFSRLSRPVGVLQHCHPEHHDGHREDRGADGAERQVGHDHGIRRDAEREVVRAEPGEFFHPHGHESLLARQRYDPGHEHCVDEEPNQRGDHRRR